MESVVLTGAAGPVAATIVERLAAHLPESRITVLAPRPIPELDRAAGSAVTVDVLDLAGADLAERLSAVGAEAVVHLGVPVDGLDPFRLAPGRAAVEARAVLAAVRAAEVPQVTVVSSTLVLGALPGNPVPMTEEAVVHPEPSFRPAVELAEIEREVAEHRDVGVRPARRPRCAPRRWWPRVSRAGWRRRSTARSPTRSRVTTPSSSTCTPTTSPTRSGPCWRCRSRAWSTSHRTGGCRAPSVGRSRPGLACGSPIRWPAVRRPLRGAVRGTSGPEGVRPYVTHPWVVANDRLREAGWEPTHTNDEAYVAAFRAAPWSMVSSSRRQELALGGAAAVVLGAGAAVIGLTARRRQR